MRKVSRLMLATIAAIQGGAHSRRKVRYLKEQALVSHLYPLSTAESTGFGAYLSSINNRINFTPDNSAFDVALTGSIYSNFYDYTKPDVDSYTVAGGFELTLLWEKTKDFEYTEPDVDSYTVAGGFTVDISSYSVTYITHEKADMDSYVISGGFTLGIAITRG